MKETLINQYLKIEPIVYDGFIASQKESYEEKGVVIAKDEAITNIPIGATVSFDSFMVKKYPTTEIGKFAWYIHYDEIVSYEN